MKKLMLLGLIPLLMAACTGSGNTTQTPEASSTTAAARVARPQTTLNGIALKDAEPMVEAFQKDPGEFKGPTSTWFSKAYIFKINDLLTKEGASGFRIYFVREGAQKNNIIIVPTRGYSYHLENPDRDSVTNEDYFEHPDPYVTTAEKGAIEYGKAKGALLYDPNFVCPTKDVCNLIYAHYISCQEAKDWANDFSSGKIETTSEWFPLTFLTNLSRELQEQSPTHGSDGLRIYFARTKPIKKDPSKHGFVFVTTRPKDNYHEDYFDCMTFDKPFDNGEQCPLSCNGVTWPKQQ